MKKWLYRLSVIGLVMLVMFGSSIYGAVDMLGAVYDNCTSSGLAPAICDDYIRIILDPSYSPPSIGHVDKSKEWGM